MKNILDVLTSNRFKSFYWRSGMMLVASFIAFLSENLGMFEFSPQITVLVGLVLGEISKFLNKTYGG